MKRHRALKRHVADEKLIAHLDSLFPYAGAKREVADVVWQRFGNTPNYVEPFCGTAAVLLARPHTPNFETLNDKDGMVTNLWRSLRYDPAAVAYHSEPPH